MNLTPLRNLFRGRIGPNAPRRFLLGTKRDSRPLVYLSNAVHTVVTAPTGAGKGVSCIIPFLLSSPESCVVVDFKGENARLTAEYRRKTFGHRTVLLDPYRVVTNTPDTLNPLEFINKDSRLAIDDCNDLANALVVRTGEEKEPHWCDSAEMFIAAIVAMVVAYGQAANGTRSLQTVRDILSHPEYIETAVRVMKESDCWGGLLAQMGGQLQHFVDKERSSVLTTVHRHLRFLGTPAIVESTSSSTFDPAELRRGKMSAFLILSPDRAHATSRALRTWINSILRACVRGGLE